MCFHFYLLEIFCKTNGGFKILYTGQLSAKIMRYSIVWYLRGTDSQSLIALVDLLPLRDFARDIGLPVSRCSFLQSEVVVIILSS